MSFLAALLLCVGLTVNQWVVARNQNVSAGFSVNIPSHLPDMNNVVRNIQTTLLKKPGIIDARLINEEELKILLKPWLGTNDSIEGLPLPIILNVKFRDESLASKMDYAALSSELNSLAPGVQIDAHEHWVNAFSQFTYNTHRFISLIAGIILMTMVAVIAFATRASLHMHQKIVNLLHAIGAEDNYIVRQFQQQSVALVLPGTMIGCSVAALIYWLLGLYLDSLSLAVMPSFTLSARHFQLLILMPFGAALAAWIVSAISARQYLKNSL